MKLVRLCLFLIGLNSCGVKGDPIPPGAPALLGNGEPRYKNLSRSMPVQPLPNMIEIKNIESEKEKEENKDKDKEEEKNKQAEAQKE